MRSAAPPLTKLRRILKLYTPTGRSTSWSMWIDGWAESLRTPELEKVSRRLDLRWRQDLAAVIAAGVADGTFQCADPAGAAWRINAVMDGLAVQLAVHDRVISRRQFDRVDPRWSPPGSSAWTPPTWTELGQRNTHTRPGKTARPAPPTGTIGSMDLLEAYRRSLRRVRRPGGPGRARPVVRPDTLPATWTSARLVNHVGRVRTGGAFRCSPAGPSTRSATDSTATSSAPTRSRRRREAAAQAEIAATHPTRWTDRHAFRRRRSRRGIPPAAPRRAPHPRLGRGGGDRRRSLGSTRTPCAWPPTGSPASRPTIGATTWSGPGVGVAADADEQDHLLAAVGPRPRLDAGRRSMAFAPVVGERPLVHHPPPQRRDQREHDHRGVAARAAAARRRSCAAPGSGAAGWRGGRCAAGAGRGRRW